MRWEDERYVRLYTRDTSTWVLLPWQSRFTLMSLLRKVDRAGLIGVGTGDSIRALEALLLIPAEILSVGLNPLFEIGVLERRDESILIINFIEAQEAKTTDRERQRKSRELARLMSQDVTRCHTTTDLVTPSLAVLSLPSHLTTLSTDSLTDVKAPKSKTDQIKAKPNVVEIFEYWVKVMGKNSGSRLDSKRRRLIEARLKDGYSVDQIKQAIDGCRNDEFNMGQNDRCKPFNDISLICRDATKLESFIGTKPSTATSVPTSYQYPEFFK